MQLERFSGIYAVMVTPFTDDAAHIDDEAVCRLVDLLIADGLRNITVCGNTGEFHALSEAERKSVTRLAVQAAGNRADVIVGVGGSIIDTVIQARHAADVGASAVMVHYPPHPFSTEEGMHAYYRAIIRETALPTVLYIRGTGISDEGILDLLDLPRVVAVKYAVRDALAFADLVSRSRVRSEVKWICGAAESWAPSFWAGGSTGFTSGLVNVTAKHSIRLLESLRADDHDGSLAAWRLIRPFERLREGRREGNSVSVVKEAMRHVGREVGPVRPPSGTLTAHEIGAVASVLESWRVADSSGSS